MEPIEGESVCQARLRQAEIRMADAVMHIERDAELFGPTKKNEALKAIVASCDFMRMAIRDLELTYARNT